MRPKLLELNMVSKWNHFLQTGKIPRPIAIEGPPGGGKTTIAEHDFKNVLKIGYIEKHAPTMLVEDFGVPDILGTTTSFGYRLPDWFPFEGRTDIPEYGAVVFDDSNQCDTDNQKVIANIEQARTLHGVPLKKGWWVIRTGNRTTDGAGANKILTHLRNRETKLELETHLQDWTDWAIDHGVKPVVISFIQFRPSLLHDFDPKRDVNPTPRSWVEGVSDVLGVVPPECEYEEFMGAVGEGASAEFKGFLDIERKLPNPDSIIRSPDTANVPTDPATCYALCGALAERADVDNFKNIVKYGDRMKPEFSVLLVSYASRKNADLQETEAFTQWAIRNQDVLF